MTHPTTSVDPLSNPAITISVGVSVLFWLAAYLFAIRRSWKDKVIVFPMTNACLNISWEFLFSFVYPDPNSKLRTVLYILWLAVDAVILFQTFRYGRRHQVYPWVQKHFNKSILFTLTFSFIGIWTFIPYYRDVSGNESAFFINLWMSISFIGLLWMRPGLEGVSLVTAWGKMIGTAIATVNTHLFYGLVKPDKPAWGFLEFVGLTIFILDVFYIIQVHRRKKAEKISWKQAL